MAFEPMLFVDDVEATSKWFQSLLGAKSAHGGREYEMLKDAAGDLLLQLHRADGEEHGGPRLPAGSARGVLQAYSWTDRAWVNQTIRTSCR
jgi:hypothetical protein